MNRLECSLTSLIVIQMADNCTEKERSDQEPLGQRPRQGLTLLPRLQLRFQYPAKGAQEQLG